jgi:hypothetical protein
VGQNYLELAVKLAISLALQISKADASSADAGGNGKLTDCPVKPKYLLSSGMQLLPCSLQPL